MKLLKIKKQDAKAMVPFYYARDIIIALNSVDASHLKEIFEALACKEADYDKQGYYRRYKDFFERIVRKWEKQDAERLKKSQCGCNTGR